MIDIHCHILPDVDDGAKTLDDSLKMAKQAVLEGITTIIATPHHQNRRYINVKSDIINHVNALNQVLQSEKIPLTILPGQEPRIFGELLQEYRNEKILSLNNTGKYIFVEMPLNHVPRYTEQLLFDIQLNGLTPIIVHPERNQEIIKHPNLLYELVKKGTYTQITAASVNGHFGKTIKKLSFDMIDANLTHFVASDAHNISSRSFWMREAYEVIGKEFGLNYVNMFKENAEILAEGGAIYQELPVRVKQRKKRILGIF